MRRSLTDSATTAQRDFKTIVVAGLVAAILEIIPALIIQPMFGVSHLRMFQSIASGVMGKAAYAGGLQTAALGVALHLLISLGAAAVFVAGSRRWPGLLRRYVLAGLAYGVLAYIVMNFIVVPLSAVAFTPVRVLPMMAMSLTVHMILFGLPIAVAARFMPPVEARRGRP